MLSWKRNEYVVDGTEPIPMPECTYYELYADVEDRSCVISASTDRPEEVCLGLRVGVGRHLS